MFSAWFERRRRRCPSPWSRRSNHAGTSNRENFPQKGGHALQRRRQQIVDDEQSLGLRGWTAAARDLSLAWIELHEIVRRPGAADGEGDVFVDLSR